MDNPPDFIHLFSVNFDGFWRWIIHLRRIIHLKCKNGRCSIWTDNSSDFIRLFRRILKTNNLSKTDYSSRIHTRQINSSHFFYPPSSPVSSRFPKDTGSRLFFFFLKSLALDTRKGALQRRIRRTKSLKHWSPRRYSWEFLVGVCRPVLQILILYQT